MNIIQFSRQKNSRFIKIFKNLRKKRQTTLQKTKYRSNYPTTKKGTDQIRVARGTKEYFSSSKIKAKDHYENIDQ